MFSFLLGRIIFADTSALLLQRWNQLTMRIRLCAAANEPKATGKPQPHA